MKPMNGKVFFDSNVVIYSYSNNEPEKQQIARNLISDNFSLVSTQVLQEVANTIVKKFKFTYKDAQLAIVECSHNNELYINTEDTVLHACEIAEQYKFSFYDSLIIAAAIEGECEILYSEDLKHEQVIDNRLTIINPFLLP